MYNVIIFQGETVIMSKFVLGLDLGVSSVGWAVVNKDDGKIVDKGVRLFSEADSEENVKRRAFRHTRRLLRRKEFRLYRTRRVLLEMGVINTIDFVPLKNPYEIRCKGLTKALNNEELATAILHLMKRNGFRYEIAEDEENGQTKIKEDYLCYHQLNKLNETGKIRGTDNKYHYNLYLKEFKKLLDTQHIDKKYQDRLLEIFEKRRHFSEGPGSATSPTPYGRYLTFGADPINLIDKMRGHCSIYPDELRAPKVCPSAELYNFLNDLNNLKIENRHVSIEQKRDIFESYILGKGKITIKQLCDFLGTSEINIDGFRIDTKGKPIITEFKSIKKIKEACKKYGVPEYPINDYSHFKVLDNVFEILTKNKIVEEREQLLEELNLGIYVKPFARITGVSEYHSLSFKALDVLVEEMFETSKNAQQIIVTLERPLDCENSLKLPEDIIISPVAYKAVNQSFKVIKAATKKYETFESVIIEMTRSKNSKDEADRIKKAQARHAEDKEKALELIKDVVQEPNRKLIDNVLLYLQQDGKSIYSGKPINLNELLTNPSKFETDHIIPFSISLDDSKNNKVLVYSEENQIKGQRTPHQIFMNKPAGWWSEAEFEMFSRQLMSRGLISRNKLENLVFKRDISAGDVREDFINRNLNDTSYITREVLNTLKSYYSHNNIPTKVFVVNGSTTNLIRHMAGLIKDRNNYCHHAIDACIIASFSQSRYVETSLDNKLYDEETGEVLLDADKKKIFGPIAESVASQLADADPISDFKFSYKIDSKPNRKLTDQTLYGTRYINGELYAIKKYKNIYDKEGETVADIIRKDNNIEKLLMYKEDIRTLQILKNIVDSYPNEKNPFQAFYKEHHEYVKKYSHRDKKSPNVISLRYIEDKINSSLDLSKKYYSPTKGKGSPVKLQLSAYRMDLYVSQLGTYKFITVRYLNVLYKKGFYIINEDWYKKEKSKKGIDDTYTFVNSFFRGDLIEIVSKDETRHFEVFKVVNNDSSGTIETSYFGRETTKINSDGEIKKFQNMLTIGKKIKSIKKLSKIRYTKNR